MSSASSSSSSRVTLGSPRRASAARTCWGEARSSLRSITALLLGESGLEAAVPAILIDQDLEPHTARRGVHAEDPQLGIERQGRPERAQGRPRAHEHHRPRIERDRLVERIASGRRERDRVQQLRGWLQSGVGGRVAMVGGGVVAFDRRGGAAAVVVGGRHGFRMDARAADGVDAENVAALLRWVINGLAQLGHAGGRGEFGTGVLEFGSGLAVVSVLNADALLVVLVRPSTNVGALLYDLRRHRSAIAGLL